MEDTRQTSDGSIRGKAARWLGIPYAKAPVEHRRWRPPERPDPWSKTLDATAPGPPPPQPARPISKFAHGETPPGSEDCLTLNVWAPSSGDGPWPVLVWSIGGGWTIGWAGADLYDGALLASAAQVIVVTFNYRLGSLGWLLHPQLGEPDVPSGNWGMLDHVAVLEWVHRNIATFGGDPSNITIGGQSAGAANVADLLVSPLAAGLFQRAILHSPPLPEAANDPGRGAQWAEDLAKLVAGDTDVAGLRDYSPEAIVEQHEALLTRPPWRGTRGAAWPALDPLSLPRRPIDAPGARPELDVLVGTARDEATFLFRAGGRRMSLDLSQLQVAVSNITGVEDPAGVIARHRDEAASSGESLDPESLLVRIVTAELFTQPTHRWACQRAAAGGRVHLFRVDHPAPDPRLGALHTINVPLLFGTYRHSATAQHFVADTPRAREISARMQRDWGDFMHGREPSWSRLDGSTDDVYRSCQVFGGETKD